MSISKKSICLIIVLVMMISLAAGCTRDNGGGTTTQTTTTRATTTTTTGAGTTQTTQTEPTETEKYAEQLTIKWLGSNSFGGRIMPEGTIVQQKLEEMYNIKFEMIQVDITNTEQLNLYFATEDPPDYIYTGDIQQLAAADYIRELPMELLEEGAPDLIADINGFSLDVSKQAWSSVTVNGKIYGIPKINSIQLGGLITTTRQDWLDKLGVTKIPETLEELEALYLRFRNDDPDNNGQKDTYAVSVFRTSTEIVPEVFPNEFGAFGIRTNSWLERDGQLVWSMIIDDYKDALKLLADWYAKEIIDPDFVLDKRDDVSAKYLAGKLATFTAGSGFLMATASTPVGKVLAENPSATPVYLNPPIGPNGDKYTFGRSSLTGYVLFGADCSDQKLIRILQMFNDIYTDPDIYELTEYGIKGEHYEFSAEAGLVIPEKYKDSATIVDFGGRVFNMGTFVNELVEAYKLIPERMLPHRFGLSQPQIFAAYEGHTSLDSWKTYRAELQKIEEEFFYNAITGKLNIDAEWDAYVDKWMKAGGTQVIEDVRAAYANY